MLEKLLKNEDFKREYVDAASPEAMLALKILQEPVRNMIMEMAVLITALNKDQLKECVESLESMEKVMMRHAKVEGISPELYLSMVKHLLKTYSDLTNHNCGKKDCLLCAEMGELMTKFELDKINKKHY